MAPSRPLPIGIASVKCLAGPLNVIFNGLVVEVLPVFIFAVGNELLLLLQSPDDITKRTSQMDKGDNRTKWNGRLLAHFESGPLPGPMRFDSASLRKRERCRLVLVSWERNGRPWSSSEGRGLWNRDQEKYMRLIFRLN